MSQEEQKERDRLGSSLGWIWKTAGIGRKAGRQAALGDFTVSARVIPISLLAVVIGVVASYVALALLRLIGLFTNAFYYQRLSTAVIAPVGNHLGWLAVLVPVAGGIIVGLMARYGSERIRGHGIPEAIESILISGSKVQPRLVLLKPLSAAISIGSGGPFGAEGPIIVTGGAFGSMVAQFIRLTSAERKTLLVAGAAAGMSATFASPVAAVLLAVELLLFEWKPRSMIPVALASATAAVLRRHLLGLGPLFPVPPHAQFIGYAAILGCVVAGVLAGILSALMTSAVYAAEDGYRRLPVHWMWWPAIGGVFVGIGGLIFPQALGVGYDVIASLLQGDVAFRVVIGVLIVKPLIWSIALGSGTSGGVLAPLLMSGAALGALEAHFLPHVGVGFWPMITMAAVLGGTMRVPFTAIIFCLELTHDLNAVLPLLIAVTVAYAFTALALKRSVLTEKIARRGLHLTCEYSIDPLEILAAREVMRTNAKVFPEHLSHVELPVLDGSGGSEAQRLFPVVDDDQHLVGVLTTGDLATWANPRRATHTTSELNQLVRAPVVVYPDDPARVVVQKMAETGLTRFPVVERDSGRLLGLISLHDLLKARARNLEAERRRERVLPVRLLAPLAEQEPAEPAEAEVRD